MPKIEFHEKAAARFSELAQDVLGKVGSFGRLQPPRLQGELKIHPTTTITSADIIGEFKMKESSINGLGEETGRFWESAGLRVGWGGAEFQAIKQLASRLENSTPLKGQVSTKFMLDQVFDWLRETLEGKQKGSLTDCVTTVCSEEIKAREIWVPIYRTYSGREFDLGDVRFRTISKPLLDRWYGRINERSETFKPGVQDLLNRERAALQGTIAACVNVTAEPLKAAETAQRAANEATALLRFLSPVNWNCRIVSHCLPIGKQNTRSSMDLVVENDEVQSISEATIEEGPAAWNIDEARSSPLCPGALEALHRLSLEKNVTEFRTDLYGALQLHARHSVSSEVVHKLVFVIASAESMFLKDSREPIQKNLGERLAFLIGTTRDERKEIINNVEEFYNIRSGLIHHGRDVREDEKEIVDRFFFNVWFSFNRLLSQVDDFKSRSDMFTMLDDRKLS